MDYPKNVAFLRPGAAPATTVRPDGPRIHVATVHSETDYRQLVGDCADVTRHFPELPEVATRPGQEAALQALSEVKRLPKVVRTALGLGD